MIRRRSGKVAAVLLAVTTVSACDGGILGDGAAARVDIQVAHPAGVVLQVLDLRTGSERTAVNLMALNGREREIRLNQGRENSYILTDGGEKLLLLAPAGNSALAIPGARSADLTLVFAGALPASGNATLILNENGSSERFASNPRFEITIPVAAARGSTPEVSAMSNLRPVPMTSLGPVSAQGSTLGTAAQGTSSLRAVEVLKSELGAVETERGTIVSLAGDVTFDFNEASIRPDARPTLDRLARLIDADSNGSIAIEGHTDSKGDDAYNRRLSLARADAVKAYLVNQGVSADRLSTLGLGETRPVAPNALPDGADDEAGRQRNRRVEVILPGSGQAQPAD